MTTVLRGMALIGAATLYTAPALAQRYDGMHGGWPQHVGWFPMLFGGLMMVLVIGAIVGLITVLIRGGGHGADRPEPGRGDNRNALDILDERYARGEIDREEYQQRRDDLTRY